MKLNIFALFALVAVLIVAGCTSYGGKSSSAQDTTTATGSSGQGASETDNIQASSGSEGQSAASTAGSTDSGAQQQPATAAAREITVSGSEFKFSPSTIEVKKGEKIKLIFKNEGGIIHNLNIDELGVATKTTAGGGTDTVEFTADKTGTFTYYCNIGSHRASGMEGHMVATAG